MPRRRKAAIAATGSATATASPAADGPASAVIELPDREAGDGALALRMPRSICTLWPVEIGGSEPRAMSLETLRQVAMPGGEVPLMPGELFFGGPPARLTTLLGACVSVTAWHPAARVGGLCHFLYPRQDAVARRRDGRFGEEALALLVESIGSAGLALADFQFKLFGGGGLLGATAGPSSLDIGGRNLECARGWAASHGLRFAAEHVAGDHYRRLSFDLDNGSASVWSSASVSLAWASAAEKETL
jgi:chemotaxis protein CheD